MGERFRARKAVLHMERTMMRRRMFLRGVGIDISLSIHKLTSVRLGWSAGGERGNPRRVNDDNVCFGLWRGTATINPARSDDVVATFERKVGVTTSAHSYVLLAIDRIRARIAPRVDRIVWHKNLELLQTQFRLPVLAYRCRISRRLKHCPKSFTEGSKNVRHLPRDLSI